MIEGSPIRFLLGSLKVSEFIHIYWGTKPLHISRNDQDYYSHLLQEKEIEDWFSNSILKFPTVQLRGIGQTSNEWTRDVIEYGSHNGRHINKKKLVAFFNSGDSILVNNFSQLNSKLNPLIEELKKYFLCTVNDYLVISPSNQKAFATHYDKEHVFALQISGSKNWYLYQRLAENMRGEHVHFNLPGEPQSVKTMRPGDLIYIPPGLYHSTETIGNVNSISLSIAVDLWNGSDIIIKALEHAYLNFPSLRNMAPIPNATSKERTLYCEKIKTDFIKYLHDLSFQGILNELEKTIIEKNKRPSLLKEKTPAAPISLETKVYLNEVLNPIIYKDDKLIRLKFGSKVITYFGIHEIALRFIISNKTFLIKEVPLLLSKKSKLAFVEKLLNSSLLLLEIDR